MAEKTYDVTELFGSDVFNEAVMKARLLRLSSRS